MFIPLHIGQFLARGSAVHGARLAYIDDPGYPNECLPNATYGELAQRVPMLAARLDALGIKEGERVAVFAHNSARFLELLYAVPATGRVLVPINFRLKKNEVSFIINDSGARVLFYDPDLAAAVDNVDVEHLFPLEDQPHPVSAGAAPPWLSDENALATINYTSGTTGNPKGVKLTHRNLSLNSLTFALHFGLTERDVYLHTLPLFHVNGWGVPYAAAALGIPQILLRKVDGEHILSLVEEHDITLMCGAPAIISSVLEATEKSQGSVPGSGRVRVVCGGSPPPPSVIERFIEATGWEFCQIYGLTETSPLMTANRIQPQDEELTTQEKAQLLAGRTGSPVLGTEIRISSEQEVLTRGHGVLDGYWNRPEETSAALDGGWFYTGDRGYVDGDGYLTVTDRLKDIIVSGGENISATEVENQLLTHPVVADAAVIAVPHPRWGETAKAIVVPVYGKSATKAELIIYCREAMAHFKCPTSIEFVDELPRTATGKVQKFMLRSSYGSTSHGGRYC